MKSMENIIDPFKDNKEKEQDNLRIGRISTIDSLKGISISIIMVIELSKYWLDDSSRFLYGLFQLFLDFLGANLLIFLTVISVIFSMRKRMGLLPERSIRNVIITRGILTMIIGILYNILTDLSIPFPLNLWGWNLLMIIGFAEIIAYFSVKIARGFRVGLGLAIILLTPQIRDFLFYGIENPVILVLHYIVISPHPEFTLIPYIGLILFASVFGEFFLETIFINAKKGFINAFGSFIKYGFLFLALGIYFGFRIVDESNFDTFEFPFINLIAIIKNQSFIEINGIPGFLVRCSSSNMFFTIGLILITIGLSIFFIDIEHLEETRIHIYVTLLKFYGRVSFSLYLLFHLGLFLFYTNLNILIFWPIYFTFLGLLGYIMYVWQKYGKGLGSLEWLMVKIGSKHNV